MAMIRYTKDHEYIRVEGDIGTVGISNHAQGALGDVVFVEVPDVGAKLKQADACAVVESVKAASDIYAPVTGDVTAVNNKIVTNSALVNEDSEGAAWFFKIKIADKNQLDGLMDEAAYAKFLKESA
jgi:glycine cleavage system H protein